MNVKRRNILVVDDDAPSRILLKKMLALSGYNVITADDGKEGLDKAMENDIDFMIVDYTMPVMDGVQMITKLKEVESKKNIPFIMVSACNTKRILEESTKLGNAYFLQKPDYKLHDLPAMIEKEIAMEKLKCRKQ